MTGGDDGVGRLPVGLLPRLRRIRRRMHGGGALERNAVQQDRHGDFSLLSRLIDAATIERAVEEGRRTGLDPVEVLLSHGWVRETDVVRLLAEAMQLPWVAVDPGWDSAHLVPSRLFDAETTATGHRAPHAPFRALLETHVFARDRAWVLLPAIDLLLVRERDARRLLASVDARRLVLVTRAAHAQAVARASERWLKRAAIEGARAKWPDAAARDRAATWHLVMAAALVGFSIGAIAVLPTLAVRAIMLLAMLPFIAIVALRGLALLLFVRPRQPRYEAGAPTGAERLGDDQLPIYSVLVPLYGETRILPQLAAALLALDYPLAKLDILLVIEAVDPAMQAAIDALDLPGCFRTVVVPDAQPRTKPKALNYALHFARGDHVVVYDAEDVPEPDQLRRVLAVFRARPEVACVQASLNAYNPHAGWFAAQFTLEYQALFDVMLPALARLGLPVPLGGTSNHFPRRVLREIGGWDPFNVTEDADLGIRLARSGLVTTTCRSTTWEEAPAAWPAWLKQRTRWLKGWMQTWLVHMRRPARLFSDLGFAGFLAFQIGIGGIVLAALLHPWACLWMATEFALGTPMAPAAGWLEELARWAALVTLVGGYVVVMLSGAVATWHRGRTHLLPMVLSMPVYWLAISVAAHRALWQLVRDPFRWEKTEHGLHFLERSTTASERVR